LLIVLFAVVYCGKSIPQKLTCNIENKK